MSATITIECQGCGTSVTRRPWERRMFCSYACSCAALRARKRQRPGHLNADHFWSFVVTRDNGCMEWTGYRDANGYGHVGLAGKTRLAHRHAWALTHGPIPDGLFCLHRCDNPPCVRPDHLFLGHQRDNVADMVRKQRQQRGERNGAAVLNEARVREIRARALAGETHTAIAMQLGVSRAAVSLIVERKRWQHVA